MSEVDKYKYFQNYYLIIDNAPIYERSTIQEATNVYVYPPYSSEPNPIVQSWAVTKSKFKFATILNGESFQSE